MVIFGNRKHAEVQRSLVFFSYVWLTLSLTYLTALKPSRVRTLGLIVAGTRIVTLRGDRPSTLRMAYRLGLLLIGPFNLLFDLIWLGGDPCNQSLRDKLAGTLVVRHHAKPIARGNLILCYLGFAGLFFPVIEVGRAKRDNVPR